MAPDRDRQLRAAAALFDAGRVAEAIAAYQHVLAAWPALPNSWFNLAMLLRDARRPQDALGAYARALDFGVDGPEEVHLRRAAILADDLDLSGEAEAELHKALAIDPEYLPALLNLGNLHEDRGAADAARAAYARVLAINSGEPLALARMAGLAPVERRDDPLLDRLRAAIARPGVSMIDRADLGFALGGALDRLGAHDDAFAVFAEANRASRAMAEAAGQRYDRAAHETLIDRMIASFPAKVRTERASGPPPPIFICGMFRSGSTLAEQMLAQHSRVRAGGELSLMPSLAARLRPYPEAVASASAATLDALAAAYRTETARRHPPGTLLTDKRPDNFLHIGLIKAIFPTARIVHTVRDPRDTALSVWFLHAGPTLAYATDLGDIAHYDREHRRLMAHWRATFPGDIFDLDYDRLVADPKPVLGELAAFCSLGWEDALLGERTSGAVRTASNWQIRQPIYGTASGRARAYRRYLDMIADLV